MEAAPPAAAIETVDGETANVHGAGCSEIVKVSPLTAMAPVLGETTELAATENWKAPSPCPFVVPDNEIHEAPETADQVQSRSVLTDTVPVPPDGGNAAGARPGVSCRA